MFCLCIGDRRQLHSDCDSLVAFEITREDYLEAANDNDESNDVHSTTPESTPMKKVPKRIGRLFKSQGFTDTESDGSEAEFDVKHQKISQPKTRGGSKNSCSALIRSSQERAKEIFCVSDEDDKSPKGAQDMALKELLKDQAELIRKLQDQLQAKSGKHMQFHQNSFDRFSCSTVYTQLYIQTG